MTTLDKPLSGRVAIVTGSSRGIGRAIALAFADAGAAVAVTARSVSVFDDRLPGTIGETADAIRDGGGRAIAVTGDIAVHEELEHIVDTVRAELGAIDLLVNNAAVTAPGRPGSPARPKSAAQSLPPNSHAALPGFLSYPLKSFKLHFDVSVFGAYRLMQLVLTDMIARGKGSIINVSSDAAHLPGEGPYTSGGPPLNIGYGGSKAALEHLTQSVAYEVAHLGVAVNALLPSKPIPTPGLLYAMPHLEMTASADDFAKAAVQLAARSADELTGQIIFHEDVLRPELGRRGWLGPEVVVRR